MIEENIPVLRILTKHELLKLLGIISRVSGKVSYLKYRKMIPDSEILTMGFDIRYFRYSKIFTYQDCKKIQAHYSFSKEEIEAIKE